MCWQRKYFLIVGRPYEMTIKEYSNEFNTVTGEKIVVLMEEIAVLESRYEDHNSGNLRTAVSVLRKRVEELKGKIHD